MGFRDSSLTLLLSPGFSFLREKNDFPPDDCRDLLLSPGEAFSVMIGRNSLTDTRVSRYDAIPSGDSSTVFAYYRV